MIVFVGTNEQVVETARRRHALHHVCHRLVDSSAMPHRLSYTRAYVSKKPHVHAHRHMHTHMSRGPCWHPAAAANKPRGTTAPNPRAWPSSRRTTTTARPCGLHQPLTGPGASCSWPALAAAGQLQPGLCQRAPGPDADLAPGGTNTTSTTEAKATRRIAGTPRCETRSCGRGGPGQPRTSPGQVQTNPGKHERQAEPHQFLSFHFVLIYTV